MLEELVAQDSRCFYMMMDASLRCHASQFQAAARFIHPSAATLLDRQGAAGGNNSNNSSSSGSSSKAQAQGQDSSSATTGSPGAGTGGRLLDNWKQTQAFLSALLSYRKVMQLLWDSSPVLHLQQWDRGLKDTLQWFIEERVLHALWEPGAAEEKRGKRSSSTDAAVAGGGKAKVLASTSSINSSAESAESEAAQLEEAAACRMLALCALSRVLITFCQQLAGAGGMGSRGSSSSSPVATGSGGASVRSERAALSEQLNQADFLGGDMF